MPLLLRQLLSESESMGQLKKISQRIDRLDGGGVDDGIAHGGVAVTPCHVPPAVVQASCIAAASMVCALASPSVSAKTSEAMARTLPIPRYK